MRNGRQPLPLGLEPMKAACKVTILMKKSRLGQNWKKSDGVAKNQVFENKESSRIQVRSGADP